LARGQSRSPLVRRPGRSRSPRVSPERSRSPVRRPSRSLVLTTPSRSNSSVLGRPSRSRSRSPDIRRPSRSPVLTAPSSPVVRRSTGSRRRSRSKSPGRRRSRSSVVRRPSRSPVARRSNRISSSSTSSRSSGRESLVSRMRILEKETQDLNERQDWIFKTMEKINVQVDSMVERVGAKVDVRDCNNNGYEELVKKLNAVEKFLSVKESVKVLEESVKTFQKACSCSQPVIEEFEEDVGVLFRKCKSIKDIENRFSEFEYKVADEKMMCTVCEKKASGYGAENEDDFTGKIQTSKFRDLKKILIRHLNTSGHLEKLKETRIRDKLEEKVRGREKKIGLVLGNIAYYLVKMGRPNSDFTSIVNILSKAKVDVGDINHSSEFVANWAPVCATVIEEKLKKYFQTVLPQTGQRPPAKGVADKATWKHVTRMVSGLVTVVPDSDTLLQAFFTSARECPGATGEAMTMSLTLVWDAFILGRQVQYSYRSFGLLLC
jgi:hypothetical protein